MTVTETLMDLGSWDIGLRPGTPPSVLNRVDLDTSLYGLVCVTPVALTDTPTDALVYAQAIYTGVVVERGPRHLAGTGLATYFADAGGVGELVTPDFAFSGHNMLQVVNFIRAHPFTNGTITAPGSPSTLTLTMPQPVNRLDALREIADYFGVEWRLNPNLTLDVAVEANLFTTTPTAVVTPGGGRDSTIVGLPAARLSYKRDGEDYSMDVLAYDSAGAGLWNTAVSTPYNDPTGTDISRRRAITIQNGTVAVATAVTAQQVARFSQLRREITASVDVYCLHLDVGVGDTIGVWDGVDIPADLTNPVAYRGETIWPLKARLMGATWPVRQGMGVYVRRSTDGAWVDLTDWFDPEDGDVALDLGSPKRALVPA